MAEQLKPNMSQIWASGGAVLAPTDAKVTMGWTPEIPPHQWENWVQNRQDSALLYLFQHGLPEWDTTTEYFANRSYVQYNGLSYRAKTNNTNIIPSADPNAWERWALTVPEIRSAFPPSNTQLGLVSVANSAETIAGTDQLKAVTPAALNSLTALESRAGLVAIANLSEVNAGTVDGKAVSPAGLNNRTATETRTGILALATQSEVASGTVNNKAITPSSLLSKNASDVETQAGTSTDKFITPAALSTRTATETRTGLVAKASVSETVDGANGDKFVTPATLTSKSATGAEVVAGTSQNKFVTPAGLAAKVADNAETQAGTIFNKLVTPGGLSSRTATETRSGLVVTATQGEVNTGSNDGKYVSPVKLRSGFSFGGDANGHFKFPSWMGGFIIQWGRVPAGNLGNDGANFAIPFPNAILTVIPTILGTTADPVQSLTIHVTSLTNTGFTVSKKYAGTQAGGSANFGSAAQGFTYIAVGL